MSNAITSSGIALRIQRFRSRKWVLRTLSVLSILVIWQLWASRPDVVTMAPPSKVVGDMWRYLVTQPELTNAIVSSLSYAAVGYVLAVVVGVVLGFLIGFWAPARYVLNPILDALYVSPLVAFVPLIIVWFGVGWTAKVAFVFLFAFFEITVNTESGVTETPDGLVDAARVFGATDRDVYTRVHLRHAIPNIFAGLRLGAGRAVRGMVVAELFVAAGSLGNFLINSGALFNISKLFAGVATLSILGVATVFTVRIIEGRLLVHRDLAE